MTSPTWLVMVIGWMLTLFAKGLACVELMYCRPEKIWTRIVIIRTTRATTTSISTSVTPRRGPPGRRIGERIASSSRMSGSRRPPTGPRAGRSVDFEGPGEHVDHAGHHQRHVQVVRR